MLILSSAVHVAEYCSPPTMTTLRFFKWRLLEQMGKPRIYGKYTHNDHRMIDLVANISWNQVVPRKPGLILQTTRLCSITSWKAKMPGSISYTICPKASIRSSILISFNHMFHGSRLFFFHVPVLSSEPLSDSRECIGKNAKHSIQELPVLDQNQQSATRN